jgi:hapalindole H/12-epi-hapalindole U/12-epi-fischerindole U synthase
MPKSIQPGCRTVITGLSLVTLWCVANISRADLITVINPSFEDTSGEVAYNEFTFGPLHGWQLYDPGAITHGGAGPTFFIGSLTPNAPMFFTQGAPHGQRVGIAFNYFGSGGLGEYGLQQTLAATLQPNLSYTLQVEIGNIASGTAVDGTFFPLAGFPDYRVDLLAGGQVLASDNNSLANTIPEGAFATSTLQFTTDNYHPLLGQALGIRLVHLNRIDPLFPNSDLEIDFDNVRLSTAVVVPEPSSQLLMLVVLTGLQFSRVRLNRGFLQVLRT